jgi:hypothetical protein
MVRTTQKTTTMKNNCSGTCEVCDCGVQNNYNKASQQNLKR